MSFDGPFVPLYGKGLLLVADTVLGWVIPIERYKSLYCAFYNFTMVFSALQDYDNEVKLERFSKVSAKYYISC